MVQEILDSKFRNLTLDQVVAANKEAEQQEELNKVNKEKSPMIPREYQYEIFREAVSKNIIAVLDTGAGKTLISVMLIKHMFAIEEEKYQFRKYKKKMTFFLVDKVPLVFQQASVIESNCDARIERIYGEMNVDIWPLEKWRSILDNLDICVLTARIFLDILQRGFLTLAEVDLVIFDECHHTTKNHPFNSIMNNYHKFSGGEKYKIFSMTAPPIQSKFTEANARSGIEIRALEANPHSKVYTAVKNASELSAAVKKPTELTVYYSMKVIDDLPAQIQPQQQTKSSRAEYHRSREKLFNKIERRYSRTKLTMLIEELTGDIPGYGGCLIIADYISNNLGPWCCDRLWKVMLYRADRQGLYTPSDYCIQNYNPSFEESRSLKAAYDLCNTTTPIKDPDVNNELLFTPKAQALVRCLKEIHNNQDFCGIIFVERRHTALAIKLLIDSLSIFNDTLRCDILIGHGGVAVNNKGDVKMEFNERNAIIRKFRTGEVNLMIATNVAEEALDIQACNVVIIFDMFKTPIAYIQSRGKAKHENSKYIMMVNSQNTKEVNLLNNYKDLEDKMKHFCKLLPDERNVAQLFEYGLNIDSIDPKQAQKEATQNYFKDAYKIPQTGAVLKLSTSVALDHQYCASLSSDEYCVSKPVYQYEIREGLYHCTLTFPINSDFQRFDSYGKSLDDVKKSVSLKVCIALHKSGAIDDNLVPVNMIRKKRLVKDEERDDEGKQMSSRSREQMYEKGFPSFWSSTIHSSPKQQNENEEKLSLGPYWVSFIKIENCSEIKFRNVCLITKQPLPTIDDMELFYNQVLFKVHLVQSEKQIIRLQTQAQLQTLIDYIFAITKFITNKDFTCPPKEIPYFIAPLKKSGFSFDFDGMQRLIDEKKNVTAVLPSSLGELNEDSILFDASGDQNSNKMYFFKHIASELTPSSHAPPNQLAVRESKYPSFAEYYKEERNIIIKDMDQPLIHVERAYKSKESFFENKKFESKSVDDTNAVSYLVPELCRLASISSSIFQTLQVLPAIMTRINATLLALDAKKALNLPIIDNRLMMEAYTTSSAGMNTNYQRLEFLGDSVLKFITSTFVFTQLPTGNEYELTKVRTSMISNKVLFNSAAGEKLKLYKYITSQRLMRRFWRPSLKHFTTLSDSKEMQEMMFKHKLSDKTLADVIESTLGAVYLSHDPMSLQESLIAAQHLGVPLDNTTLWSDFNTRFKLKRPKSNLSEANVTRISSIIGYSFKDPSLLVEALTHASFPESSVKCYQRLEFLGDAVLDFCVTNYLFTKYHTAPPGLLHDLRKSSVNNGILAMVCVQLGLHCHIRHTSNALIQSVTRFIEVLADVIESILGAVFTDAGFELDPVLKVFNSLIKPVLEKRINLESIRMHPLSKLSEIVQSFGCIQCETIILPSEKKHPQTCVVFLHGRAFSSGHASSIREAKKLAAENACLQFEQNPGLLSRICNCSSNSNNNNDESGD